MFKIIVIILITKYFSNIFLELRSILIDRTEGESGVNLKGSQVVFINRPNERD